ncbi:hypothetical protein C0989_005224 [Termitomyces sp. Mn162]|nr:hypothetical protein C0989_005224 [Termitomyces sp. Mn162]
MDMPGHMDFSGVALVVGPMTQTRFVLSKALSHSLSTSATATPSMAPLFDLILVHVPPPMHLNHMHPFLMLTVQIESNPYVGMLYVGCIHSGILCMGNVLWALDAEGQMVGKGKVKKIFARKGLERIEKDAVGAGEIVSVAGVKNAGPPPSQLLKLCRCGVLHLGILLEMLKKEGFKLAVGPPKAVIIPDPDAEGRMLEPIEECTVLIREEYAGAVMQKLTIRKGEMVSYETDEEGWVKAVMDIPARGLIGYMAGEFGNDVHGQG